MDLNVENGKTREIEDEDRPKIRRVMSGTHGLGLGRRDVWKSMGMGWNLAIKAQRPLVTDITLTSPDRGREDEM